MADNPKTTISLTRHTYNNAQRLREKAAQALGKPVCWDAVVEGMCAAADDNGLFVETVKEETRMPKIKCQVCGEVLGSMKEVKAHFRNKHQTKEAVTLIE